MKDKIKHIKFDKNNLFLKRMNNNCLKLEDLSNELFYELQTYLTYNDFYESFSNLNKRFDNLLLSMNNIHYEIRSSVYYQQLITSSFASRITSIIVPSNSDGVSIATIFPNVRSVIFYRAIRLIPTTLPIVENIKIDLTSMKPKQSIGLFSLIYSDKFPCLSSFSILHRKSRVTGFWKLLFKSINHSSLTLTKFIFNIKPTIEWNIIEHLIKYMPNLKRFIIQKLNTRTTWTLSYLTKILQNNLLHLEYIYFNINSLGTKKILEIEYDSHPLFRHIETKIGKSKKIYSTTIITSSIH